MHHVITFSKAIVVTTLGALVAGALAGVIRSARKA